MRVKGWMGRWVFGPLVLLLFSSASAWGYYLDDRQEMGLAGFFYSRGTIALQDGNSSSAPLHEAGNLVQHRNFGTLEWRHNINRVTRGFPTLGTAFEFLDLDAFDYYMNLRAEYDGVWDYGPARIKRMKRGTRLHRPYFDDPTTSVPFDGLYFTPFSPTRYPWSGTGMKAADFPANVISLTNRRYIRQLQTPGVRFYEWYFNLTKGPLFIRVGRQNLSWGEADAFRLLDQINPLDNSFGGFLTALDERRIPINMLRAQWTFGTVGFIDDLTLEGFWSIGNGTNYRYRFVNNPGLPTSSTHFWHTIQGGTTALMWGRTPCGGHYMAQRGIPPYFKDPKFPYAGSGFGPRSGGRCSQAGASPHPSLDDGRGGVRILGTIHDFTFSLAHYYTYNDITWIRAHTISPTRDHLRWDLGFPTDSQGRPWADNLVASGVGQGNTANPWGLEDPFAARAISSGANAFGRGNFGVGGAERNIRSTVNYARIQVTGASLSFPVNALTGIFVGPESPLYYLYTVFRSEIAYFRDYPTMRAYKDGDGTVAFSRFLGTDLSGVVVNPDGTPNTAIPVFRPGGVLAHQAGSRAVAPTKRDWLLWVIGIDHNQWIRWLNPTNSFVFSTQLFYTRRMGQQTSFNPDSPFGPGVLNDRDDIAGRTRRLQQPVTNATVANICGKGTGSRRGCSLWKYPREDWLFTLAINTPYVAGNVVPRFVFFYDWMGSYLIQPGIDWTFWEPFRLQIRYNYIEGRGNGSIGTLNRKDNVWLELQYLLY